MAAPTTPRQTILDAMRRKRPGRIPLMCQFSWGFMAQQLKGSGISPMELWCDAEKYAAGLLLLQERFQFDGILVSIHGHAPHWRSKILKLEGRQGIKTAHFKDRVEKYVEDDLPMMTFDGRRYVDINNLDIKNLDVSLNHIPSSRDCHAYIDPDYPFQIFDLLDHESNQGVSIHGEVTSPLDYLLDLLGYEQALMAMLEQPDRCLAILEKFTDGIVAVVKGMSAKNIDAIKVSSPFAGMGFISPENYRLFEYPFIKRIVKAIRQCGKISYIHTCGHIDDRLEIMRDTGADGLECLDPPPIGNVELRSAFERIGGDMFIKGNIDPVYTLLKGDKKTISMHVNKILATGSNYPGFILSTACAIAPMTPPQNVRLLRTIVDEFNA